MIKNACADCGVAPGFSHYRACRFEGVHRPKVVAYLAGPMRGLPEFNFPAFVNGAARLRGLGFEVFSPAERDLDHGFDPSGLLGSDEELAEYDFDLRSALGDDTAFICAEATAVVLLPGWQKSSGALAERALAIALGLDVLLYEDVVAPSVLAAS